MSWPSIAVALVDGYRADTGDRVGTKVPSNVETLEKFVRFSRGPGTDDQITDSPLIDVECFSTDYGTAEALAESVRQWFHSLTGRRVGPSDPLWEHLLQGKTGAILVDRVQTASAPMWVDYKNPSTNRFVASYRLEFRQSY